MEKEENQFMVNFLMMKILKEDMLVLDYYQWEMLEEIQIQVNL